MSSFIMCRLLTNLCTFNLTFFESRTSAKQKTKLSELLEKYDYDLPLTPEELKLKLQKQLARTGPDGTVMSDELSETFSSPNRLQQKLFGSSITEIMDMPEVSPSVCKHYR
jgi:hypothetical protein